MKRGIVIAVALGLVGCKASIKEAAIIAAIESKVRLPVNARPLDAYARFYAYGPDDVVVGNYLIPPSEPDLKLCEEEKAIEKKENVEGESASRYCPPPRGVGAGEHRWMSNYKWLPGGYDGGCNYIDVIYDLASERFLKVECHGSVE
ncbi:hypothetical protein [Sphingobium sp. CR28]|uniref:hypothetical protein n=1 Tax=Sphingobium sp. CR28 TaxID=3400272 RepID=UPI003FF03CD2